MRNIADNKELVDISAVQVDSSMTRLGRTVEFVRQIRNPYHFHCGGYDITAKFNDDGPSFEECLQSIMA